MNSELEHISKKMSSPRNPLDLGNAIVDINAAITRVPVSDLLLATERGIYISNLSSTPGTIRLN